LARQIKNNEATVENEYSRVVKEEGNILALRALDKVFEPQDVEWRGFPVIPQSGMALRSKYQEHDARLNFQDELAPLEEKEFPLPPGCKCHEVLRGLITSRECALFAVRCTPQNPIGPCIVSAEGSCNIEYRYGQRTEP
ncbi:MAG: hydrogenase formation protein HypD, partial [Candidatus Hodarchaeota archaeon]